MVANPHQKRYPVPPVPLRSRDSEPPVQLAIFDLDHTLLNGDSDYAWGQFLAQTGAVDAEEYARRNRAFYEDYLAGTLDIDAFLKFSLAPLAQHPATQLEEWRNQFLQEMIAPMIQPAARALVEKHREKGHTLMIITATNAFVTEPIAALFGIDHLLATRPERNGGQYTGEYVGIPTFQEGKIRALEAWLQAQTEEPEKTWFYSDSRNDIPLLEQVDHPVAVDPDEVLKAHAETKLWPIISLRD